VRAFVRAGGVVVGLLDRLFGHRAPEPQARYAPAPPPARTPAPAPAPGTEDERAVER